MGNSQSYFPGGQSAGNEGDVQPPAQIDYYILLEVDEEAGDDEIKVSRFAQETLSSVVRS